MKVEMIWQQFLFHNLERDANGLQKFYDLAAIPILYNSELDVNGFQILSGAERW